MVILYGIPNCDTVKKARTWLTDRGIAYDFHDYKKSGIDHAHIETWADALAWEQLLNRAGTTFRQLPDADKADIDRTKAIELMLAHPSTIKRPVVEHPGGQLVGFKPGEWDAAFPN